MFAHNERLLYTVRVSETNPVLANLLLEQFGGPQGELAAAMLLDIGTEELSHLEVIGFLVVMLNKGERGPRGRTEQGRRGL